MYIEIIATDVSNFNETGFGGIESCYNFYKATKYKYPNTKFTIIESIEDLDAVIRRKPDFVVFGFKYFISKNKKIWLSDYFAKNNIDFLGSTRESIEFDSNKVKAKEKVSKNGIKTAQYFIMDKENRVDETMLEGSYPLFVKPMDAACSFGVDEYSLVKNYLELKSKVNYIGLKFGQSALVEEFLPGKEYTVVILGNGKKLEVMPVELGDFTESKNKFLSRADKVANIENPRIIEEIELKEKICDMAKKVFTCLKARDFARIDIKLDKNNTPHFIEINMMPGFTKGRSYLPIACEKNNNLSYDETIISVIDVGIRRIKNKRTELLSL